MRSPSTFPCLVALALLGATAISAPALGQSRQADTLALAVVPLVANVTYAPAPTLDAARVAAGAADAPRPAADARRRRAPALTTAFYGALAAGAGIAAVLHVDPDSGGYPDGWTTATDFPDKAIHGLVAWAITNVGVDLGARPRYAALAVCAAGTAFEFAQGYASPYDMAADCVGASGAALWQSWRGRRKARAAAATAAAGLPR